MIKHQKGEKKFNIYNIKIKQTNMKTVYYVKVKGEWLTWGGSTTDNFEDAKMYQGDYERMYQQILSKKEYGDLTEDDIKIFKLEVKDIPGLLREVNLDKLLKN